MVAFPRVPVPAVLLSLVDDAQLINAVMPNTATIQIASASHASQIGVPAMACAMNKMMAGSAQKALKSKFRMKQRINPPSMPGRFICSSFLSIQTAMFCLLLEQ